MHADTTICAFCHDQCVSICPIARVTGETTAYPSRKALTALLLERRLIGAEEATPLFSGCIGCHLCREQCVWLTEPKDAGLVTLYARTMAQDLVPAAVREYANAGGWSEAAQAALAGIGEAAGRSADGPALVIWPDPVTLASPPEVLTSLCRIADRAGLRPVVVREPLASGLLALQCGDLDRAMQQARRAIDTLKEYARTGPVVATSPADVVVLRELVGDDTPIGTVAGWLSELVTNRRVRLMEDTTPVTFQDPSSLARGLGDVVSVRTVVRSIRTSIIATRME